MTKQKIYIGRKEYEIELVERGYKRPVNEILQEIDEYRENIIYQKKIDNIETILRRHQWLNK